KSSDITLIKRQSPVLAPYRSASEAGFHRGAGITLQKSRWEFSLFASRQSIDTHIDLDSVGDDGRFTSMLTSGYHRTQSEVSSRNNVKQLSTGGSLKVAGSNWHLALNTVSYQFSKAFQKRDLPYNLFASRGKSFLNSSIDYSFTVRNLHVFGEAAINNNRHTGFITGALIALAPELDISLVNRFISRQYGSVYGNAFTENPVPSNERGTFAAVSFRPSGYIRAEVFADLFRFPWLRYRVDAPSSGREYLVQITYTPNKQVEVTCRYRTETKQLNQSGLNLPTRPVNGFAKQTWRVHSSFQLSKELTVRHRCEVTRYGVPALGGEQGLLMFMDLFYKPALRPWTGNIRLAYFSSDSYNSRLYAYESDLGYSFSIPALFNTGYRYYMNLRLNLSAALKSKLLAKYKAEFGIRFAQSIYPGQKTIGSGMDEIQGKTKSDGKFQLLFEF
ncbi:MAG TPA: hypothetical protein VEZ17_17870, partial [Chitinophagaceae bacterium]|nr:hypothetical protein [Chitinophagaceae bacterium]